MIGFVMAEVNNKTDTLPQINFVYNPTLPMFLSIKNQAFSPKEYIINMLKLLLEKLQDKIVIA